MPDDTSILAARWRDALDAALRAEHVHRLPPSVVPLMVTSGRWTPEHALALTRLPAGAHRPQLLTTLAPHLRQAQVERLLERPSALPAQLSYESASGISALLRRSAQLTDRKRAFAHYRGLSARRRALTAPTGASLASTEDRSGQALAAVLQDTRRHIAALPDSLAVDTLLDLLPVAAADDRRALIDLALERLTSADFPVTPSHWRRIGAADPQRPLRAALEERMAYPRAWRFAAASWHLKGAARRQALREWLEACETLVGEGFAMRGNSIPTPLPPDLLDDTLRLLRDRAGALDRAYVLGSLAAAHPQLLDEAVAFTSTIPAVHRALAWIRLAPLLGREALGRRAMEAVTILARDPRAEPDLAGGALFNIQRAWTGWDREGPTAPREEWLARAIALLPQEAQGRPLNRLLIALERPPRRKAPAKLIAQLAALLPAPRRPHWLGLARQLADPIDPEEDADLDVELALADPAPPPEALCASLSDRRALTPEDLARLLRRADHGGALRRELLRARVFSGPGRAWERWGAALLGDAPPPLLDEAWEAASSLPAADDRAAARCVVARELPEDRHPAALAAIAEDLTSSDGVRRKDGQVALWRLLKRVSPPALDVFKGQPGLGRIRREALARSRPVASPPEPADPLSVLLDREHGALERLLAGSRTLPAHLLQRGGPELVEAWAQALTDALERAQTRDRLAMRPDKRALEALIRSEKTVGRYVFIEAEQRFLCDTEIQLYLSRRAKNTFRPELWYFDGYEIGVEDGDRIVFEGDEATAKRAAIDHFNDRGAAFIGYPIDYTNVTCHVLESL